VPTLLFVVRGTMFYKKSNKVINKERIVKYVYNNTTRFSRPHRVCHPHRNVSSSTLVRTVAQVEKHCTRLNKVGTHSIGLQLSCWKSCIYLLCLIRGVEPFAIAGRITFIYMKYGRQWVRVIFMRYVELQNRLLSSANQHRTHSNINAYSFYNSLLHHHPHC